MSGIDIERIEERKETLISDIEVIKTRLSDWEKRKSEDSALLNALGGALQQCNEFLNELNDVKGDDGVVSDESWQTTNNVPSVTFPPKCNFAWGFR